MIRAACLTLSIALGGVMSFVHSAGAQEGGAQEVLAAPSMGLSAEAPALFEMLDAMGMYDILAIMGAENIRGAGDMEAQMFPGAGGAAWQAMVTRLHSSDRMASLFEAAFPRDALTPEQIAEVTTFLHSDAGQRVISGEVAARFLFLEEDAVDASNAAFMAAVAASDPRLDILQRFNEVNGLIERNVSGALNLRFAFYRGLIDGGAFDADMPESLMLAEVWAQEPEVRQLTVEWLYSYQLTAYSDASDGDLEAYVALSETAAGRALNAALFAAFDHMLGDLSYDLGAAAAIFIAGEDA